MKINSKGFIEPEVGDLFKIGAKEIEVMINEPVKVYDQEFLETKCHECTFGQTSKCGIFPCGKSSRDDNNNIYFKKLKNL